MSRRLLVVLVASGLGVVTCFSQTVVFTTNTTITAGDSSHDGSNILVQGCTLAVQGYHRFAAMNVVSGGVSQATNMTVDSLALSNASLFSLAGGSLLTVSNRMAVDGVSTVLCQGANTGGQVSGSWAGTGVVIQAGSVQVSTGCLISADSQGYSATVGPGGNSGNAGGTHGGVGGVGAWGTPSATTYGEGTAPVTLGSGGGSYDGLGGGTGGAGGGAIRLMVSNDLVLDGEISANGQSMNTGRGDGGGAGGSLYVTAGALSGGGRFTATGGTSLQDRGGGGGGGRVAVYYTNASGFLGFTQSTAMGGTNSKAGAVGTVAFFDTSTPNTACYVYQNMAFGQSAAVHYGQFTLDQGGVLTLGGGSTFLVDDTLRLTNNARMNCLSLNAGGQVNSEWVGTGVVIQAATVQVSSGSVISADSQGYAGNTGPGGGGGGGGGNCGGTHAGLGGIGAWGSVNTSIYGHATIPVALGSGGGNYDGLGAGTGGAGGGAIRLMATNALVMDGEISADGQSMNTGRGDGGGAGGSLMVIAGALSGSGRFSADGGGSLQYRGGGGSGGRIMISASSLTGPGVISAVGSNGVGGGAGGSVQLYVGSTVPWAVDVSGGVGSSAQGASGSSTISNSACFIWSAPSMTLFHDTRPVEGIILGGSADTRVDFLACSAQGASATIATDLPALASASWNTRAVADGCYQLRAALHHAQGAGAIYNLDILVNNAVTWHGGTIATSETWGAGSVHVVESAVVIPTNVTVTVAPGAVVKFARGTSIDVRNGGAFCATGTVGSIVILTALADDSAGGDSNLDGDQTKPQPGDWLGINAESGSTFAYNANTDIRYLKTILSSSTLSSDTTWLGTYLYQVSGDIDVASGVTLTIQPGAIVKFASGKGLTIAAGGRLVAQGSAALPITLTSIKDDSVGGDTNGDGSESTPAAGDWTWLYIAGTGTLDHVILQYAGYTGSGSYESNGGLHVQGSGATVSLLNSMVMDVMYDAIMAMGGGGVAATNSVVANSDRGVNPYDGSSWIRLVNCVLDYNRIGVWGHSGDIKVYNTVISHSIDYGIDNVLSTPYEYRYCNVWSETGSNTYRNVVYTPGQNGNLSVDPSFRDYTPMNRSYRLNFGSPCIDAADGTVASTNDFMAAPRYTDPRSTQTGVPMPVGGAYPDMGAYEFVETAASDIDLIGESVSGPASGMAGDTVTISWAVRNLGTRTVSGSWHDALYLAPNTAGAWDTDIRVAEVVSVASSLGPNKTASFSATVRVPGGTEGSWHWRVKVNSRQEVFEGINWLNNAADAASPMSLSVPALVVGGTTQSVYSAVGVASWYKVTQPANVELMAELDSAASTGACRLVSGYGRMPNLSQYDGASSGWNSPDAGLVFPASAAERTVYCLLMPGSLGGTNLAYAFSVRTNSFSLTSIGVSRGGNAGQVTVPVFGSQLSAEVAVALRPSGGGADRTALTHMLQDSTTLFATFNLSGATPGVYSVVASKNGLERMLTHAFTVTAGQGGSLVIRVVVPGSVRQGRPFLGHIEYSNVGDADYPAPLLLLKAVSAISKVYEYGTSEPSNNVTTLNFLGVAEGALPSVIPPGKTYRAPFSAVAEGGSYYQLRADYVPATDALAMDYATLEAAVRPAYPHVLWSNAWARVVQASGSTRGAYVSALGRGANRAKAFGLALQTEQAILSFMVREAIEAVQVSTVSGTAYLNDAAHPLSRALMILSPSGDASGTNQLYITTTWYDGTFGLRDVPAGSYDLTVDGYMPTNAVHVDVAGATPVSGISVIVTGRWARIYGKVADGYGSGLTNAMIRVLRLPYDERATAQTDSRGQYELARLPAGDYQVSVEAPGYFPAVPQTVTLAAADERNLGFTLNAVGGSVSGVVRSPGSNAVAGATVVIGWTNASAAYGDWRGDTRSTDALGRFQFVGLPPGAYRLSAGASGYGESVPVAVTVTNYSSSVSVDLTLRSASGVTGVVVDAGTLTPIAGARVEPNVYPPADTAVYSDAQGRFTLSGLATGSYRIYGIATNYLDGFAEITLAGSQTSALTIALSHVGRISGYVRGGVASNAAAHMPVVVWSEKDNLETVTDAQGYYVLDGISTGRYAIGLGSVNGMSKGRQDVSITATQWNLTVNFTSALSSISGTIHGVGGTPQSNATVYLVNGSDLLSSVQSDAQGGYRFWVYAADTYAVLARAAGALCAPVTHVAVGSNAQVTGQNGFAGSNALALEVVAAAGGAPVSNAEVRIQLLSDPTTHILANQISSNAAGWYAFSNVPPGSYRARIVADRFAAVETSVTLTGTLTTAHVELAAGRSIHGQVCTNGGVGLPFSQVDVCQSNGVLLTLWAGATGGYGTVSAPGSLLSMAVVSHRPFEAAFVAADMRSTTSRSDQVTLAAASTAVVSGVVRDGLGSLVAGAGLSLLTTQGTVIAVAQSDLDGRFSVPWWPSGSFVLKASALGYGSVQTNVTLVSGASLTGLSLTISEPLAVGAAVTNSSSFVLQRADGLTRPHGALPYRGGWWGDESYNGIPHPSVARDRYGKDFMVDVFNPWYDAYQHGRHNCNGVLDNYSQAKYWNQMMDKTYNNWCTAYENMKAQQGGQAVVTVSKGILWGAKAVKFLWSVAEMGGNIEKCIKDPSGFGMTPADLDKAKYALNTLNSIAGYVGTARSAAATGQNVNNAGLTLQSISAAMGQVKDLIASTPMDKFMPQAAGLLSDGIQLYNGFADFLDEANKMGDFQSAFDYLNAQYSYDYAIQQYWKNRRQMINSIADCKTGDDTDPTDPPPQEPSNPGDTGGGINGFSGDPNIKVATGYSTLGYIPAGERIYYTIHFENMTNVTAPAAQVSIADQLDARLDWTTLQLGDIGFNQVLAQVPAGLTAYATHGIEVATDPNPVSVSAFLDQSSGVVTWTLQSVDRATGQLPDDPLAGFLPPNTNPPCGEGYVSFSVCVRTNLAHGDTITNSARIVFDVNAPIETPMVTNTVDLIAPSSAVNALPSRSASTFTVSWAGTDSGSGIATYDVYMNQDSGALTLWLTGTTATSASFNGAVDVTYGFTCVARDHVGLVEAGPRSTLDTSTRVVSATPPSGVSASKGTYTDRVLLSWNTAIYATAYEVWRAAVNDSAQAAKLADAAALLYADTSVQPGSRYYYWVKSRNEAGLSDFSLSDMGWRRSAAAGTLRYGDFDGDGIADIGLYQESTGYWYVMLSASGNSLVTAQLGGPTYRPVTGDYDGDGKTDPAVYQELSGAWAVMMSSQGYGLVTTAFGGSGYTAVPADYDGDGKADPAVYASASGAWVVMMSGQGYAPISAAFGGVGFSAVPSDYDGDGKADPAVYQEASGAWAVMMSSQGYAPVSAAFGGPGYRPVPMDYDGDGKVDPAVYAAAAGLWSVMMSAQGYTPVSTVFGGVGYWPVPTDYDGDGRMDPALYQTVTGQWLMMLSGSGYIQSGVIFGGAGFDPVLPVR